MDMLGQGFQKKYQAVLIGSQDICADETEQETDPNLANWIPGKDHVEFPEFGF